MIEVGRAPFVYLLEGRENIPGDVARLHRLDDRCGGGLAWRVGELPGGGRGVIAWDAGASSSAPSSWDGWEWRTTSLGMRVGCSVTDARPTASELMRERVCEGSWVQLGDGDLWLLPVLRYRDGRTTLPTVMVPDGAEGVASVVRRGSAALADAGERLWRIRMALEEYQADGLQDLTRYLGARGLQPLTRREEVDLAVAALGVNYRLHAEEVALLELLGERELEDVTAALMGDAEALHLARAIELESKKKITRDALDALEGLGCRAGAGV